MGKGTNTTKQEQSTAPNPAAMAAYNSVLGRASEVANTPYQAYGGQLTADFNPQQQAGVGSINANAGFAQPYISEAAAYARQAGQPISQGDIERYQDPYTQMVVNATQAQFNNQNQQQQSSLLGNAAAKGALGGDRVGVAQANLAGQQNLAQSPVIAGLYSQGFNRALQAAQQQQAASGQAGYALGNLGVAGQQAGLAGGQAQLGAGGIEQQSEQQRLNSLYQQFQLQQAFPYQQTQWLAGINTGVGSQMGGTTSGTLEKPPPNQAAQWAGLGLSAAGMFMKDGGRIAGFAEGGAPMMAPYGAGGGYVPMVQIVPGKGAPGFAPWPSDAPAGGGAIPGLGSMPKVGGGAGLGGLFGGGLGTAGTEGVSGLAGGEAAPLGLSGSYAGAEASGGLAGFGETLGSWGTGAMEGLGGLGAGAGDWLSGLGAGAGEWFSGLGEGLGALFSSGMGEGIAEAVPALFALVKDGGRVDGRFPPMRGVHARGGAVYLPGGYDEGGTVSGPRGAAQHIADWLHQRELPASFEEARDYPVGMRAVAEAAAGGVRPNERVRRGFSVVNRPYAGYDDGGAVDPIVAGFAPFEGDMPADQPVYSFADRAWPVQEAIATGTMRPEGGTQPDFDRLPVTGEEIRLPRPRPPEAQEAYERSLVSPGLQLPPPARTSEPQPEAAPVMGFAPASPVVPVSAAAAAPQRRGFGLGLLDDAQKAALLSAGFGMMASQSPHLGTAIGQGGLAGVQAYGAQRGVEREAEEKKITHAQQQRRIDLEAERLSQHAKEARERMGETKRYHDILDANRKDALENSRNRAGYIKNPDGSMSPIKGGPADPEQIAAVNKAKVTGGLLPDDTADFLAERILAGDSKALTNLGRGAQGAENVIKVQTLAARKAAERGMSPNDILAKVAEQSGLTAQQRTFGTQVAKMAVNSTEAEGAIQQGLEVSQKVPRTKFVPVNKLIQMAEANISDPDLLEFRAANLAIINTYARAISPTGTPTVHDKEEAMKIVSEATSPEAYQRVMHRMLKEIEIAHAAPLKAKEEMERIRKSGQTGAGTHPPAAGGAAPAATPAPAPAAGGEKAKRVIQGGWEYELQSDGNYKPLRKVP